jgi:hypothetical protein
METERGRNPTGIRKLGRIDGQVQEGMDDSRLEAFLEALFVHLIGRPPSLDNYDFGKTISVKIFIQFGLFQPGSAQ